MPERKGELRKPSQEPGEKKIAEKRGVSIWRSGTFVVLGTGYPGNVTEEKLHGDSKKGRAAGETRPAQFHQARFEIDCGKIGVRKILSAGGCRLGVGKYVPKNGGKPGVGMHR